MNPAEPESPPTETPEAEESSRPPEDAGLLATIEAFIFDLDAAFSSELAAFGKRSQTALESTGRALDESASHLKKSREKLAALLQQAQAAPNKEKLRLLTNEIDGQLSWIFRKVRPAGDRELRSLAPRKKPVETLPAQVERAYARAVAALPDEFLPPPAETAAATLQQGIPDFVRQHLSTLAARLRFFAETNLQLTPRSLAEEILAARPSARRHPKVKAYDKLYAKTASHIADIWRGVRFHLEVAVDDLEDCLKTDGRDAAEAKSLQDKAIDSAQLALEMLAEAEKALPPSLTPLTEFLQQVPDSLTLEHREFVRTIRRELENVDSWEKVLRHLARRTIRRLVELRRKGQLVLEEGSEEMRRSASSGIAHTGNLLKNIQGMLGLGGKTEEALLTLTDLPSQTQILQRAESLPAIYQRLFTLGPLKHREFLVAREEELEDLEEIFQRWQAGKACSVAIVGPEGSGKTSLVNCFENQFGSKADILRLEIPHRLQSEADVLHFFQRALNLEETLTSLDDLVARLLAAPRRILIIEGGFRLGLRVIGGYRAVRAFLFVLMATRRHLLWMVTFRKYPWNRLDHQLGISQYFTHQVQTLFHDEEEIREAILLRHRTSGLELTFETEGNSDKPAEKTRASGEEKFFHELFEASSGSIEAAIYYWLLSVAVAEDTKTITIAPLGRPQYGFLRALGRDYLFALGEVLSHGELTADEYCEIFRRDPLEGRMLLDYLVELHILLNEESGQNGSPLRYRLNPIFFGPAADVLESMNILY